MSKQLDDHWIPYEADANFPVAYYRPGEGEEEREGMNLKFKVQQYELGEGSVDQVDAFPTRQRVDVILKPDWKSDSDRTIVVLGGWGETSAMFTGGFLDVLVDAAKKEGAQNPAFIFPNTGGRATRGFAQGDKGSVTHFQAAMNDAKRLPQRLLSEGFLGGPVTVIGHSMGDMGAWKFMEGLWELKERNWAANFRVKQHTGMMPATDSPAGAIRPDFLWAVRDQVLPATQRYVNAKGLQATNEEYNQLMLGSATHPDGANYSKSTPDSARVFLEWVMNFKPQEFVTPKNQDFKANVFWAVNDRLLPAQMGRNQHENLKAAGIKSDYIALQNFSHAIPFQMTEGQKAELKTYGHKLI